MSEVAGRSTLIERIQKVDASVRREDEVTTSIINQVKEMEHQGYQFEGADATLEMLIRKQLGQYRPFFRVEKFKTIGEQQAGEETASAAAMVKVVVGGQAEMNAAEGNGPVNALDCALRKSARAVLSGFTDGTPDRLQGTSFGQQQPHRIEGKGFN